MYWAQGSLKVLSTKNVLGPRFSEGTPYSLSMLPIYVALFPINFALLPIKFALFPINLLVGVSLGSFCFRPNQVDVQTGWLPSAPDACALHAASVPSALHPCPDLRSQDHICVSESCIDLIISGSGVKNPELSAGDVQRSSAPPNPDKQCIQIF